MTVTLPADAQSFAVIDIAAKSSQGELIEDRFGLTIANVHSVFMANPCAPRGQAAYFIDSDIRLHYTMETHRAGARVVVGYGYYPVEFEPKNGAQLGESEINGLLPIRSGSNPGTVEIASTISGDHFAIDLVTPADTNALKFFDDREYYLNVGESANLYLLPQVGDGVPVCQSDVEMIVKVDTPRVCQVDYVLAQSESDRATHLYETNILELQALAEGHCEFIVTMPAADGGNGITVEKSVPIRAKD